WKDYKAVTRDLKAIYQAPTEEAGQQALEAFAAAWDSRYPQISCVFRSIRSRIGIEVRSAIRIHSINRELNFFYRFLTRFFAAFH
ncbi:transposase, partial [Escherichia coli]|uniref:transposase n=1 Tax=Escherichia coli TaxID=562 RepID=UPI00390BCEAE